MKARKAPGNLNGRTVSEKTCEDETRFRFALESTTDGIWDLNVDTNQLFLSPRALHVLGYEPDTKFTHDEIYNYIHKTDHLTAREKFMAYTLGKAEILKVELRVKTKTGEWIWIRTCGKTLEQDKYGNIIRILGTFEDITNRKRDEEELKIYKDKLRNERTLLRSLIDNLPFTIYVSDKEGRKVISNKADVKLIGCNRETEVLSKTDLELFPGAIGQRGHADNMCVIETGKPIIDREETFFDDNGNQNWLLTTKLPSHDINNQITGLIGIGHDITERKLLEQKIIESETYYRTLIDISPYGILIVDKDGKVLYVSKRMYEMVGEHENSGVIGRPMFTWVASEYSNEVIKNFIDDLTGKVPSEPREHKLLKSDGSEFWSEIFSSSIGNFATNPARLMLVCQDITKRKQSEKALIESEEKFRNLFENLPGGAAITGIDGIVNANKSFCDILGYSEAEANTKKWMDFTYPEDISITEDSINSLLDGKIQSARYEKRYVHKNGSLVWADVSIYLQRNQEGEPQFYIAAINDITERKRMLGKIIESETYYRTLIDISPDGVLVVTLGMNITYLSKKAYEIFGIPSDTNVCGTSVLEWIVPEYHQAVFDRYSDVNAGNILPAVHEHKLLKYDKTVFWAELSSSPIADSKGKISGVLIVCRDISDRKKAEEELKKNQAQLLNAHRIAHLGAWEYDLEKDTFIFNDPFYAIFRTTAAQVGGYEMKSEEYFSRFVHPDDLPFIGSVIPKAIETDDPDTNRQIEHRFIYGDGESGYLNVRVFIGKDENGKTVKVFGVNQDITDRKKIEFDLIKAKEKAEESDRLKTAFLHNISHEIRTPLNGIMGFSSLLGEPDLDKETQRSFIEIIAKSGDHLLSILNDIIEISNIEAGILKTTRIDFNINPELKNLHHQFSLKANEKKINFSFNATLPDSEAIIQTDKTKVIQVLSSLLFNAFKFTPGGKIEFGYILNNEYLEFYVSDTGIGIPNEMHLKIFERFSQVEQPDSRKYEGTGLGLSISKAYVELLGGKIWLTSEPGKGSAFYFTLPYKQTLMKE